MCLWGRVEWMYVRGWECAIWICGDCPLKTIKIRFYGGVEISGFGNSVATFIWWTRRQVSILVWIS